MRIAIEMFLGGFIRMAEIMDFLLKMQKTIENSAEQMMILC